VWVKLSRVEGASFASVKLEAPPASVNDLPDAILASPALGTADVASSLANLRLVPRRATNGPFARRRVYRRCAGPHRPSDRGGRDRRRPPAAGRPCIATCHCANARWPHAAASNRPAAQLFAALVEGRVVGEVITRTLPDGS